VAICVLHNLAYVCFYKDLHQQREAALFAGELAYLTFRATMPHPNNWRSYGTYRTMEISLGEDVFATGGQNGVILDASETLLACQRLAIILIDFDLALKALPLLCLAEHLANDVV
jgi:hypothetical protein